MKDIKSNTLVGEKLKQSKKGRLVYEREWHSNGKSTEELLEEWTSPPKLSPSHAAFINTSKHQSPGYSVRDGIIHMRTSTPKAVSRLASQPKSDNSPSVKSPSDRRIVVLKDESDSPNPPIHLSMSPDYGRKEKEIRDYEQMWQRKAKEAVEFRRREIFDAKSRQLEMEQKEGLIQLEVEEHKHWERSHKLAQNEMKEQEMEILRNVQKIKDTHQNRKKFLDGVVKTVQVKKSQLEEEAKQHQREIEKRRDTMLTINSALQKIREALLNSFKTCQYKQHLPDSATKLEELQNQLKNKAESILRQASGTGYSLELVQKLHQVFQQAQNALEYLTPLIEAANKKGEEEKQEQLEREKALAQKTIIAQETQPEVAPTVAASTTESNSEQSRTASTSEELDIAPEKAFENYVKLLENLASVEQSIEDISKNPQFKKYKFDLQKSVNTPVNAISPVSGEHLRDKLLRLCKLLGGHPVEVGTKRVSAKDHPQGISFCKHLLAKMLVKKADEQVSSIHESAFAIAMVTVGVWAEHPDLGDLLLAQFYTACPYLVPYYVPLLEGQTNEDHLKAQGYKFDSNGVEKQDKFLKRMSGLMRLFAAIMVSSTPRNQTAHPFGLEHAWQWLTNVMNMKPHPDITATLIYDLLEVTGHALFQTYNKQFQKLLHYLLTVYLPKIQAVAVSGGPVARLQIFLETCVKQGGRISRPEGLLGQNFWYT